MCMMTRFDHYHSGDDDSNCAENDIVMVFEKSNLGTVVLHQVVEVFLGR